VFRHRPLCIDCLAAPIGGASILGHGTARHRGESDSGSLCQPPLIPHSWGRHKLGGTPKPPDCVVSSFLAITGIRSSKQETGVCRGAQSLEGVPILHTLGPKRVQGRVPAEGFGLCEEEDASCREPEGVPQLPFFSPKTGGQGVEGIRRVQSEHEPVGF
jgi:hypothetical protein